MTKISMKWIRLLEWLRKSDLRRGVAVTSLHEDEMHVSQVIGTSAHGWCPSHDDALSAFLCLVQDPRIEMDGCLGLCVADGACWCYTY